MLSHWLANNFQHLIHADQVSQKEMGKNDRQPVNNQVFRQLFPDFFSSPGGFVQSALLPRIPFYPIFNFPENHLHEHRLRTNPPAKQPTEDHRKQNDENDKRQHGQHEQVKILRGENQPEQYEFSLQYIEQKELLPIYLNKRKNEKNCQKRHAYPAPPLVKFTRRLLGVQPNALAFSIHRGEVVTVFLRVLDYLVKKILVHIHCSFNETATSSHGSDYFTIIVVESVAASFQISP